MIALLWHLFRHGHSVAVDRTITVNVDDLAAKGWLYTCECGKTVAR